MGPQEVPVKLEFIEMHRQSIGMQILVLGGWCLVLFIIITVALTVAE